MSTNTSKILKEGHQYDFRVLKTLTLYDENNYFVIEALNYNKYLLNCALYKNYGIEVGDQIRCKVDKINCSGRIFLEPEHPTFKEGGKYILEILSIEELIGDTDDNEQSLIVKDEKNNIYTAILDSIVSPEELSKIIKVKVRKVSKARLYIEILD